MPIRQIDCEQTCKGICTSLEVALDSEKKAIALYEKLRDQCVYPDVRLLLDALIAKRREILHLVEETQSRIREKFKVLDQVRSSFESL